MGLVWVLKAAAQPTSGSDLNPGKLKLGISDDLYAGFPFRLSDAPRCLVGRASLRLCSIRQWVVD